MCVHTYYYQVISIELQSIKKYYLYVEQENNNFLSSVLVRFIFYTRWVKTRCERGEDDYTLSKLSFRNRYNNYEYREYAYSTYLFIIISIHYCVAYAEHNRHNIVIIYTRFLSIIRDYAVKFTGRWFILIKKLYRNSD